MPLSAPAALAVSVVLSALGAVVLCLLVAFYGFTPASSARRAGRRQLVTGIGHAVAASCFAATAILIAIVLVQSRHVAPSVPRDDVRVPALGVQVAGQESRLVEQGSRLTGHESRLTGQESRLAEAEARLEAIDDAVRRAAERQARQAELPVRRASTPLSAPAASARTVPPPGRVPAPEVVVVRPAPASAARPHDLEGSAFTTPPAPPPVAPLATTAPPTPPVVAPALPVTPSASVPGATPPPAAVVTPPARRVATDPTPAPAGLPTPPATPSRPGLLNKLREDWATIRRSFESGEDDFRRAMDETRRNFRGLVGE